MKSSKPLCGTLAVFFFLAFLTGGCDKSTPPSPDNQSTANKHESPPTTKIEAEPFHGQVYRSENGRTVLTLISREECELSEGGTILLCKYTNPNDTLRVVTTALGTSQVIYFRFTDQGLEDNKGNVLLSPEKYAAAIEQQRQQEKEEQKKQLEAERKRLEEQRVAEVIAKSKIKTREIASFPLAPSRIWTGQPTRGTVTLTDVSLIFIVQYYSPNDLRGPRWSDEVASRVLCKSRERVTGPMDVHPVKDTE